MICLIIVNSVNLALDTPLLDPSSNMSYNLQKLDYLLSGLFVLEAVVKIIAVGFYNCGKTSYIRNFNSVKWLNAVELRHRQIQNCKHLNMHFYSFLKNTFLRQAAVKPVEVVLVDIYKVDTKILLHVNRKVLEHYGRH